MRRKASRNNKNAICNAIENTCKQKQNRHTLMVGWEKPVTRYNKNNNKKNKNKNLHCHKECSTMAVRTYAGDREWLNARGKKSLRSARWHACSLSLTSLLLRSLALSIFSAVVQCYCTTIFTNISATVKPVLSDHAWAPKKWSLNRGGLLIEVKMYCKASIGT